MHGRTQEGEHKGTSREGPAGATGGGRGWIYPSAWLRRKTGSDHNELHRPWLPLRQPTRAHTQPGCHCGGDGTDWPRPDGELTPEVTFVSASMLWLSVRNKVRRLKLNQPAGTMKH